jgi:hypothetical protein
LAIFRFFFSPCHSSLLCQTTCVRKGTRYNQPRRNPNCIYTPEK